MDAEKYLQIKGISDIELWTEKGEFEETPLLSELLEQFHQHQLAEEKQPDPKLIDAYASGDLLGGDPTKPTQQPVINKEELESSIKLALVEFFPDSSPETNIQIIKMICANVSTSQQQPVRGISDNPK